MEDIERVDLDSPTQLKEKFTDWDIKDEWLWANARKKFVYKEDILKLFNLPLLYAPEMLVDAEDASDFIMAWKNFPGNRYREGYNPDMGDKGLFFKS